MPYINIFISSVDQKEWLEFFAITLFLWCVIPTVVGAFYNGTEGLLYYNRFIWYIEMYCLGAYFKKFGTRIFRTRLSCGLVAVSSMGLLVISVIVFTIWCDFFSRIGIAEPAYFWPPNTILLLTLSVSTFLWFEKTEIKQNGFINVMASGTLGVYMLHDGVLTGWLWQSVFKNATHQESEFLIIHILIAVFAIFVVGTVIDLLRQQLEKALWRVLGLLKHERI